MTDHNRWHAAVEAVVAASTACRNVGHKLVNGVMEKGDRSPVTVADFASQAVIAAILEKYAPDELLVAEEDSAELRTPEAEPILAQVVDAVAVALQRPVEREQVLAWIDRGGAEHPGEGLFWTLDPIDGTKGFLRGDQYAVALAQLDGGGVQLGVLGCPNMKTVGPDGPGGLLLAAQRGGGTLALPLNASLEAGQGRPVRVDAVTDAASARFCEPFESAHSDQGASAKIAALLGITAEPLRMDSQAKYAAVARGDASIYMRLPRGGSSYTENIWDHAAGMLCVQEAGGRVTDLDGRDLDFTRGTKLVQNRGVIATSGRIHEQVLEAAGGIVASPGAANAGSG